MANYTDLQHKWAPLWVPDSRPIIVDALLELTEASRSAAATDAVGPRFRERCEQLNGLFRLLQLRFFGLVLSSHQSVGTLCLAVCHAMSARPTPRRTKGAICSTRDSVPQYLGTYALGARSAAPPPADTAILKLQHSRTPRL